MPYCSQCGAEGAANYCGECGKPQGANEPRKDVDYDQVAKAMPSTGTDVSERVLFVGTTWPMCCLSPLCCCSHHWKVTSKHIDWDYGCCQSTTQTLDIRRVKDLQFRAPIHDRIIGRGIIIIHTDGDHPVIKIAKRHTRELYIELRNEWSRRETGMAA